MILDVGLGLNRPSTLPLTKLKKLFMVIGELYIGSRPDNITPITQVAMVDCCAYQFLFVVTIIVFMTMKYVIVGIVMEDVEVLLNISATINFTMK